MEPRPRLPVVNIGNGEALPGGVFLGRLSHAECPLLGGVDAAAFAAGLDSGLFHPEGVYEATPFSIRKSVLRLVVEDPDLHGLLPELFRRGCLHVLTREGGRCLYRALGGEGASFRAVALALIKRGAPLRGIGFGGAGDASDLAAGDAGLLEAIRLRGPDATGRACRYEAALG